MSGEHKFDHKMSTTRWWCTQINTLPTTE